MKLALTQKEIEFLKQFLDDGAHWGRPLDHPHRTLLEKFLKIKDEADKKNSYIFLSDGVSE